MLPSSQTRGLKHAGGVRRAGEAEPLPRSILVALCLLAPLITGSAATADASSLPDWLLARLEAAGLARDPADASEVRIVRSVLDAGEARTFEVPASTLPSDDPFPPAALAPPAAPDALVGQLTTHLMVQLGDCPGYGAEPFGAGIARVEGASWAVGIHLAQGPAAGGLAASTSGDPATNLVAILGTDVGMDHAVGQLAIQEDRLVLFGQCFALLGQMSGTGAWVFS